MQATFRRFLNDKTGHWRFFRQWLRHPLATAAISPSGPVLVRSMLDEMPAQTRRVIELGAGTGVMTKEILARGIAPEDLLVLELNEDLVAYLREQFPATQVVKADARFLPAEAERIGYAQEGLADTVISSLGLLSMPTDLQQDILSAAFSCMKPEGSFIQFTYGPRAPVKQEVVDALGLTVARGATVLRNVPPATVFVYTRSRSRRIAPRSSR